jgi:transmembrane sensor
MNASGANSEEAAIRDTAARWVVRQDRRLSAAEAVELELWLAADRRHAVAFQRSAAAWRTFRTIGATVRRGPEPAGRPSHRNRVWVTTLAAAAALTVGLFLLQPSSSGPVEPIVPVVSVTTESVPRLLADGSTARLKAGAEIAEAFSSGERRVRLLRGEAYFAVTKDAARPFLVEVDKVTVRAVGTAFAIRFESHAVDVLVTQGTVEVSPVGSGVAAGNDRDEKPTLVHVGHRAVVPRRPKPQAAAIVVSAVSAAELANSRAWGEPMLALADATLGELVVAFAQRTGRRIEIDSAELAAVRIGGRPPMDDVEVFLRALGEIYDVKSERRADGTMVLRRTR